MVAVIAVSGTMTQSTPGSVPRHPAGRARLGSSLHPPPPPASLPCSGQRAPRLASRTPGPRAQHGGRADAAPRADRAYDTPARGPRVRDRDLRRGTARPAPLPRRRRGGDRRRAGGVTAPRRPPERPDPARRTHRPRPGTVPRLRQPRRGRRSRLDPRRRSRHRDPADHPPLREHTPPPHTRPPRVHAPDRSAARREPNLNAERPFRQAPERPQTLPPHRTAPTRALVLGVHRLAQHLAARRTQTLLDPRHQVPQTERLVHHVRRP